VAYLLTEDLGGSGVIAVVAAGLVIGNLSLVPLAIDPKKRTHHDRVLGIHVIFLVNSIVFLLLG
jgi:CPA1 family monovalent cation:H+ antiporter